MWNRAEQEVGGAPSFYLDPTPCSGSQHTSFLSLVLCQQRNCHRSEETHCQWRRLWEGKEKISLSPPNMHPTPPPHNAVQAFFFLLGLAASVGGESRFGLLITQRNVPVF